MSNKRPATDAPGSSSKAVRNGPTRESTMETDEMGEFEDAWEDEIEDDEVMGEEGGNDGTGFILQSSDALCTHNRPATSRLFV